MGGMSTSTSLWTVTDVPVTDQEAGALLRVYFAEMVGRYTNRPAGEDEVDAAMAEDPSNALSPPSGRFLLARYDGRPAGCVGLKLLDAHFAEVKRMFIAPGLRGHGGGARLLHEVEQAAVALVLGPCGWIHVMIWSRHALCTSNTATSRFRPTPTPPMPSTGSKNTSSELILSPAGDVLPPSMSRRRRLRCRHSRRGPVHTTGTKTLLLNSVARSPGGKRNGRVAVRAHSGVRCQRDLE